jgi:hypothetical protein
MGMATQDITVTLPDGSKARFLFSGASCWVEIYLLDDEFAPSRTHFSDGLPAEVGQVMIDRALKGVSIFEACGHPPASCGCFVEAPEAEFEFGGFETDFGASSVPPLQFEVTTTLPDTRSSIFSASGLKTLRTLAELQGFVFSHGPGQPMRKL